MHKKGGIGLAILEAFRKLLLAVRVFWLLLAVLGVEPWLAVLLLVHSVGYDIQVRTHNKSKKIKF